MSISSQTPVLKMPSSPPARSLPRTAAWAMLALALLATACTSEEKKTPTPVDTMSTRDLNEFRDCPGCPVMVELPPGTFLMGAPEGEAPASEIPTRPDWTEKAEKPQVKVEIDYRLAVGKYEVTFEEWARCVKAGGCEYQPGDNGWGRGRRPVIHVARTDAKQYVEWLSEHTGEEYRLPSEAEWEYAARAGTETARWWGDGLGDGIVACDGCGHPLDGLPTAPVDSFPPNPWGLHGMLTNAEEWVADCWHSTHEGQPADGSARIETSPWWKEEGWEARRGESCKRPVDRGGTVSSYPWTVRAAQRNYYWPSPNWTERDDNTGGFRVVREMETKPPDKEASSHKSSVAMGPANSTFPHAPIHRHGVKTDPPIEASSAEVPSKRISRRRLRP